MSPRSRLSLYGTISLALCSSVASAQSADKSAAIALFDEADSMVAAGNFREACPKYAESNRLDPQLGALMHLADCYEKAGQLASAWASFRDAAEIAERRGDPRADTAADRATALEPRLSRLSVMVPPEVSTPGLEIKRDGAALGSAIWGSAIPVDLGEHIIDATAPGKVPWKGTIKVDKEGAEASITVPVLVNAAVAEAPAQAPGAPGDSAGAAPKGSSGGTRKIIGWSTVGGGVVGLGVGIVFVLQRSSKLASRDAICPTGKGCTQTEANNIEDLTHQARSASTIGTIGLIAGGLLTTGGLALVFTAPRSEARVAVTPIAVPSFQGLVVRSSLF